MPNKAEKVVFFFPWREVSGGPYYLTGLANELCKDEKYEVFYSDYEPGLSDKMLKKSSVQKLIFSESKTNIPSDTPVTLVTPIYWAHQIPKIHPESKIVFFNWHNMCIPVLKKDLGKKTNEFLSIVNKTDSVFFLDKAHWQAQNNNKLTFNRRFVPASIPPKKKFAKPNLIDEGVINIAILGRLCEDKISSVINLLNNLESLEDRSKKNLYIIGDGAWRSEIIPSNYKNNISIHFKGTVSGEELNDFLINNADILFAMGTSSLEGASLKIPSAIIPHSMTKMDCDRYVYIQNTKDFCLGWYDSQIDTLELETLKLRDIIDDIYRKGLKSELAESGYEYYIKNHTIEKVITSFKEALSSSNLKYDFLYKNILSKINYYKKIRKIQILGIGLIYVHKKKRSNVIKVSFLKYFTLLKIKQTKNHSIKYISLFGLPILRIKISSYDI
jgi:hypothetical protein